MLERNDELIERFNKEEQKRQRLQRRKRAPHASKKFHKLLDRLDEVMEKYRPVDCIAKKWIES